MFGTRQMLNVIFCPAPSAYLFHIMGTQTKGVTLQQKWIWYHLAGSFLGVVLTIAFDSVLEWLKVPASQVAVGMGMGTAIGLMQWAVLRRYGIHQTWIWLTVAGFTLGYVLFEWVGAPLWTWGDGYALVIATVASALLTGWLQYRFVLKAIPGTSTRWIGVYTLGWLLAHVAASISGPLMRSHIPRTLIFTLNISLILSAGPILGWVTGRYLLPFLKDRPVLDESSTEGDLI
jgi:hypothetical protein